MISKLATTIMLVAMATPTIASDAVTITCGDHWFEISATTDADSSVVSISGDSVGDVLMFEAAVNQRADQSGSHIVFTFGDLSEQTLSVSFDHDDAFGVGIYSENPDWHELHVNCTRR